MCSSASALRPSKTGSGSSPRLASTIFTAAGSSPAISARTRARASASSWSALFRITRSALANWSSNSSCSGDSWSRLGSWRRCWSTCSGWAAKVPAATAGLSTTVITASTVQALRISGHWKACTSGLGRARPLVSMRIWSRSPRRATSSRITGKNSSCTVQHRQPLASSKTRPCASSSLQPMEHCLRISPSMPSSPNSLTITAMRRPSALSSMCRSKVVLPAPRKPVTMVTGSFARVFMGSPCSARRACGRVARTQGPRNGFATGSPRPVVWKSCPRASRHGIDEAGLLAHGLASPPVPRLPASRSGIWGTIAVHSCGGSRGIDRVPS